MSLTPKQSRFVDEYVVSLNATQAAIAAGYAEGSARVTGCRLLASVSIREALAERMLAIKNPDAMTLEEALVELSRLARADMGTYATWGPAGVALVASEQLPAGASVAVSEVNETVTDKSRNTRFKLHDKRGALESIVKIRQWQREQESLEQRVKSLEEKIMELGK